MGHQHCRVKYLLLILVLAINTHIIGQDFLGLEGKVPSNWSTSGGSLTISEDHYKLGSQSVKWNWVPGSQIIINKPSGMAQACQTYKGGMTLWIYNEVPQDKDLVFEYSDANNTLQYYFNYHLNFKGWRACWIRFDEDMFGAKNNKSLTVMRIKAPADAQGGTLFFDRMKFPSTRINDRVTPDAQLPYINPEMNANHWGALWHWHSTYKYELLLPASVTIEETAALAEIRTRITNSIAGSAPAASRVTAIRNEFNDLDIQRIGDRITGKAFVIKDERVVENDDKVFGDLDALLYDMAKAWYHNRESGFDQMFIDILDWLYDQGLTVGSGLGTNHHYGYDFRGFPKALFLMKETLKSHGKLQAAMEMLQYWTGVPEVRQSPGKDNFQGVMDTWNTILNGRLMAVLMRDDSPELVRDMASYIRWTNAILQFSPGTMGGLKADGTGYHHGMHYAGYINGGYGGLGELLSYIGNTHYNLSEEARLNFKKALSLHMWTANKYSLVSSICGRHPINQEVGTAPINALAYLAKASDPVDKELAAEYMRLTKYKREVYDEFVSMGIQPAATPAGNISANYAALNLHRRDNWLVAIKGFNNIVTGTEIYTSNNRYGRYQSYGTIQVLASGDPVSASASGFKLSGWDWNRFPGATIIHLPYEKLNYSGGNINERSHKMEFAGACSQDDNGSFGMILDENNYTNYTPDFVARKSVFAFDNRIVCLGSGISNSNSLYNTETVLFQNALVNTSDALVVNGESLSQFPLEKSLSAGAAVTVMDTKGNGYYIPGGNVKLHKKNQESRDNKTKAVNYGDFATAWIDHGKAPVNTGYEYVLLVQTSGDELNNFKTNMETATTAPYEVVRKDNQAHIVKDRTSQITGYVVFDAVDNISERHVKSVSQPCIVMVKEQDGQPILLTVADPALNMEPPTDYVHAAETKVRQVQVTLHGRYTLKEPNNDCKVLGWEGNTTILELACIHGLAVSVELIDQVPMLSYLMIDGANPPAWTPGVAKTSITIPPGHDPLVEAVPLNELDIVETILPGTYPGVVSINVSNAAGVKTQYELQVYVAGEHIEDFENFTEEDWVNTTFVGNNFFTWYVNAKKGSHLDSGTSVYSFNNTLGVWSQEIPGGISSLSFEAKDIWAEGEERILEVKANDKVVKTQQHTGVEKYTVTIDEINVVGNITIGIRNISAASVACAIDNIRWTGYAADRNAFLNEIRVNDQIMNGFDQEKEVYDFLLDSTDNMPVVSVKTVSDKATVTVRYPESIPGVVEIKVVAEDGSWKVYNLNLDFYSGVNDNAVNTVFVRSPVQDWLDIECEDEMHTVSIYNLSGRLVLCSKAGLEHIYVGNLKSGYYVLELRMKNGGFKQGKFMKK